MSEVFHEHMIKRNNTVVGTMVRILSILLCISSLFLMRFIGGIAIAIAVLFAYGIKYAFTMTDVEYEYSYLQGECQIDKICGKEKRKGCGKIEMEKVEIIAPEGDSHLAEYEKKSYKLRDFSSLEKGVLRYVVFERKDSELIKVIFEPSEDIINEMKNNSPRKVVKQGENSYI